MGKRKAKKKSNSVNKTNSYLSRYQVKFARRRAGTFSHAPFCHFFPPPKAPLEGLFRRFEDARNARGVESFRVRTRPKVVLFRTVRDFRRNARVLSRDAWSLLLLGAQKRRPLFSGKHVPKADPFPKLSLIVLPHNSSFITGKTDYQARRALIAQDKNKYNTPKYRFVVRFTNKRVICQIVYATIAGDVTVCQADSLELDRYGLKAGYTNYPATYATGLLCARRMLTKYNLAETYEGKTEDLGEDYHVEAEGDARPFKCFWIRVGKGVHRGECSRR